MITPISSVWGLSLFLSDILGLKVTQVLYFWTPVLRIGSGSSENKSHIITAFPFIASFEVCILDGFWVPFDSSALKLWLPTKLHVARFAEAHRDLCGWVIR